MSGTGASDDDEPDCDPPAAAAVGTGPTERVIIALDLDAFYVAACRKRDPTLNGLPVAIKQKHIVATCSYEARALGVKKLGLIKDAVRLCPELVLVNGEDLSYFRKVSNEIFRLVSAMVKGGLVEKLGMDELFCDVTGMVDEMMETHQSEQWLAKRPFGIIVPQQTEDYIARENGHSIYDMERTTQRLLLGTHIARQIRERVEEEVGLTSSAGIASSKYLAKLIGNTNKPNKQTVLAPLHQRHAQQDVQRFLDPFPVRSLNGFGSSITVKMCDQAIHTLGVPEQTASSERMTVMVAREIFDWRALQRLFGDRLADRLLGLLHGIDDDPVVRAPDFPAQISIEDTYQGLDFWKASEQFVILSKSLLRRLETELIEPANTHPQREMQVRMVERPYDANGDPLDVEDRLSDETTTPSMRVRDYDQVSENDDLVSKPSPDTESITMTRLPFTPWKRYPLTMRLSVRQGYTNRVSRQTRMPVDVFDVRVDRTARARILAKNCESLFKTIISQEGNKGQGLNLINIAALELSPNRPAGSIGGFFRDATVKVGPSAQGKPPQMPVPSPLPESSVAPTSELPTIDMQFLLELPKDIRAEVAAEYGITLDDLEEIGETSINPSTTSLPPISSQQSVATVDSSVSTVTSSFQTTCEQCGRRMNSWLQHDHARWPVTGMPPDLREEHDWDDEDCESNEDIF